MLFTTIYQIYCCLFLSIRPKKMYVLIISLAVGKTHSDILVRPARRKRLIVCSEMEAIGKKIKKKKTG